MKTLGSADDNESASSWVIRMKSLSEEKKKAEKKVSLTHFMHSCVCSIHVYACKVLFRGCVKFVGTVGFSPGGITLRHSKWVKFGWSLLPQ